MYVLLEIRELVWSVVTEGKEARRCQDQLRGLGTRVVRF